MGWRTMDGREQRAQFVIRASQTAANLAGLCREFWISRSDSTRKIPILKKVILNKSRGITMGAIATQEGRRPNLQSGATRPASNNCVYWLGGLGGSGASMVFGGAGDSSEPSPGSGLTNCGCSLPSGIYGRSKPNSLMRRRSSFP